MRALGLDTPHQNESVPLSNQVLSFLRPLIGVLLWMPSKCKQNNDSNRAALINVQPYSLWKGPQRTVWYVTSIC